MMNKCIFLIVIYIGFCLAVDGNKGACATRSYTDVSVDWNRFLGKWYNLKASKSFKYQSPSDKCTVAIYTLNDDSSIKITNKAIREDYSKVEAVGRGVLFDQGHLKIKFSFWQVISANYEIVYMSDDYSVAAIAGCNGFWKFGSSNIWILARDYDVPSTEVEKALDFVDQIGFDISDIISVGTSACAKL